MCIALPANAVKLDKWQAVPASTVGTYRYLFRAYDVGNCTLGGSVLAEFKRVVEQRANVEIVCASIASDGILLDWRAGLEVPLIQLVPTFVDAGCNTVYWQVESVYYLPTTNGSTTDVWDKIGYWLNPFDPRLSQDLNDYLDEQRAEAADDLARTIAKLVLPILIPVTLLGLGYVYVTRRKV